MYIGESREQRAYRTRSHRVACRVAGLGAWTTGILGAVVLVHGAVSGMGVDVGLDMLLSSLLVIVLLHRYA